MGPPHYGWPIGLSTYLHVKYGGQWAYSGSFAMYCHADALGLNCRQPDDIDILMSSTYTPPAPSDDPEVVVIDRKPAWNNIFALVSDLMGDFQGEPSAMANMRAKDAEVRNCQIRAGGNPVKIDIGTSSAKFGSVADDTVLYTNQSISWRILKVSKLIETKESAYAMLKTQKHADDIAVLKTFLERTKH